MPGCITPHGMFLKVWCAVRFALAVFYIFGVPYDIAVSLFYCVTAMISVELIELVPFFTILLLWNGCVVT